MMDDQEKHRWVWELSKDSFASLRVEKARSLLIEIAHCPVAIRCLQDGSHPCSEVVRSQHADLSRFHLPEPWTGQIVGAPLLFLSSNPSFWDAEAYPVSTWSDEKVLDFFENRFTNGWIENGTRTLLADGSYSRTGTAFLAAVRSRAKEFLERDVRPGADFVLSEVVHCKSGSETGVHAAFDTCVDLYLERVLDSAGAPVVIAFGEVAKFAIRRLLGVDVQDASIGPVEIAGRPRMFGFLPHPNSFKAKTFTTAWSNATLAEVRSFLAKEWRGAP